MYVLNISLAVGRNALPTCEDHVITNFKETWHAKTMEEITYILDYANNNVLSNPDFVFNIG